MAYMNFKRKSTIGWSIMNVSLDFSGGVLSLSQLFLDSYESFKRSPSLDPGSSWFTSAIPGNPTKLLMAFTSIAIDVIFIFQHIIYKPKYHLLPAHTPVMHSPNGEPFSDPDRSESEVQFESFSSRTFPYHSQTSSSLKASVSLAEVLQRPWKLSRKFLCKNDSRNTGSYGAILSASSRKEDEQSPFLDHSSSMLSLDDSTNLQSRSENDCTMTDDFKNET